MVPEVDVAVATAQFEASRSLMVNAVTQKDGFGRFEPSRVAKTWEWVSKSMSLPLDKIDPAAAIDTGFRAEVSEGAGRPVVPPGRSCRPARTLRARLPSASSAPPASGLLVVALDDLSLDLARHEFVAVARPLGLRQVDAAAAGRGAAGAERRPTSRLHSMPVVEPRDDTGIVFQRPRRGPPWHDVLGNVSSSPRATRPAR
jgi:hypothetical protein